MATAARGTGRPNPLPWALAVIALVSLVALVAAQYVRSPGAPENAAAASAANAGAGIAGPGAPDISRMTPRERAERLYDRAMRAKEAGKRDSASFFASMATITYQQLPDITLDDRYDLGRLSMLTGALAVAKAESDSILASRPTHLLGLMLAEDAARALGDEPAARAAHAKLVAAGAAEQRATLPEYQSHQAEITAALARARGATRQPPDSGVSRR